MANVSLIDSLLDVGATLPEVARPKPLAPIVTQPGDASVSEFDSMTESLRALTFGVRALKLEDGTPVSPKIGRCIVREDTGAPLDIHGSRYVPMQPAKLCDQARELVSAGLVKGEKAFTYDNGRIYGVSCTINGSEREINKGDGGIAARVTFGSSVNGSAASSGSCHSHRVICRNTALLAIRMGLRVRHTGTADVRIEEVRKAIAATLAQWDSMVERYRFLAGKYPTSAQLRAFYQDVVSSMYPEHRWTVAPASGLSVADSAGIMDALRAKRDQDEQDDAKRRAADEVLDRLVELTDAEEIPAARGSMWGAYNAVTKYLTHERGSNPERRAIANLWGPSANTAALALSKALDFAKYGRGAS